MTSRDRHRLFAPALTRARFLRLAGGAGLSLAAARLAPGTAFAAAGREMRTRAIPVSGERIPVVGLGTYPQFDVAPDSPRMADLTEVVRRLFAGGGAVIDSSPMYGRAEARVGDILATLGARDRAFLATKVWTRGRRAGIEQMTRSLQRMNAGVMDLMQVHNLVDLETHLETLRRWKADGRIRYFGVTHYTTAALPRLYDIIAREIPDFVQLGYSINQPEAEDRILPFARDQGVAVIVNEPFDDGRLFRLVRGRALPGWAGEFCESWAQFFLKYILAEPAVTCVIPGTGDPDHMSDNLGAGMGRLPTARERRKMRALIQGF